MVESQPSKLLVAGSIPVSRSNLRSLSNITERASVGRPLMRSADLSAEARRAKADVAQLAERVLGKDEVTSSILVIGSSAALGAVGIRRSCDTPSSRAEGTGAPKGFPSF